MTKRLLPFLALMLFVSAGLTAQTLVAHYPFDGNANDVSPFANNATVGGAVLAEGYNGQANGAYSFDGVRDSIFAPAAPQLNTPDATYAFWVKVDSLVRNGEYYLFSYGGYQDRIKMSLPGHGYPVMTTNTANGIKDGDSNPEALVPGEWTHLAFVHARDTNFIFINGTLAKFEADDRTKGGLNPTNKVVGIGYDAAYTGSYFAGDIDDVRIYDAGMTRAQVAALYASLTSTVREVGFEEVARLFPNPASGQVVLETALGLERNAAYEIIDLLGRSVARSAVTGGRQEISLAGIPAGAYVLRVSTAELRSSTKFMVR